MSNQGHLRRLTQVWEAQPLYFITTCVARRRDMLANPLAHEILRREWVGLKGRHGWAVGRYVIMPDHVHFMVQPCATGAKRLHVAIGKWKEWTARTLLRIDGAVAPFWQAEFFDHVLRSAESRSEKWTYIWQNPMRAGLVARAEDWPYAGSIDFE